MSLHSYSRVWVHLIWTTLERRPLLSKTASAKLSAYLTQYASEKGIYMKINFVNSEHVHALIDLPTHLCIEDAVQLFKGSSSHWVNQSSIAGGKFAWGRGYGAFSVSQSGVGKVSRYIATQQEHHHQKTFAEEYKAFVERYGLEWRLEKSC